MRVAVVDIGSNTIKLKVFDVFSNDLKEIYSEVKNSKLISYIVDKKLSPEGLLLLCNTITELKLRAEKYGFDVFSCFATASLRRTDNSYEIIKTVYDITNEKIDLIDGNNEAYLSFLGVKMTLSDFPEKGILLDMGGGSTEIVSFNKSDIENAYSMNFGSLSLFLDYPDNDFDKMQSFAVNLLKQCNFYPIKTKHAVLVGGTALAINKLYNLTFDNTSKHTMELSKLVKLYNNLKTNDHNVKNFLKENVPDRTTTVIPGLAAYVGIFKECSVENIIVSTAGIREGYVFEKIINSTEKKQ